MAPFVYLASICSSLQCLIYALTQAGRGGLLFRFTIQSCCGEGGALQTNVTGVCGSTCSVPATLSLPPLTGVCFPRLHCSGSRLLYRNRALSCMWFQFSGTPQKRRLNWACILCLPHPRGSGSQELEECTLPGCGVPSPLCGPCLKFLHAQVWCTLCLFWGAGL